MRSSQRWVADPSISWRILATATLASPLAPEEISRRLGATAAGQGWPTPPLIHDADLTSLEQRLLESDPAPLRIGVNEDHVVVSAHHSVLDGLGLLAVLERLGAGQVRSGARGVGDRVTSGTALRTALRRLNEAVLKPPARIDPPRHVVPVPGDRLVRRTVSGTFRTAEVIHAASSAVLTRQRARSQTARHVAIAVGAVRSRNPDVPLLGDRSVLLRLTDVERMDADDLSRALAGAPVQTPPVATTRRAWTPALDRVTSAGLRILAPRLGSTLLISHLGEVTAPAIRALAFYPVTAGGTGLSLGAVGLDGNTVLTLRARGATWNDDGLEQLLEAIVTLL